jgi:hypothetical protein
MAPDFPSPKQHSSKQGDSVDAALHDFVRGYLHQDLADEYGTPANAAARFCAEAAPAEASAARRAWDATRARHAGDLAAFNAHLQAMGSSWLFGAESELDAVSEAFAHGASHSRHPGKQ